jgi:hypothetical protein
MWSLGCIWGELLQTLRGSGHDPCPLFPGHSSLLSINQIDGNQSRAATAGDGVGDGIGDGDGDGDGDGGTVDLGEASDWWGAGGAAEDAAAEGVPVGLQTPLTLQPVVHPSQSTSIQALETPLQTPPLHLWQTPQTLQTPPTPPGAGTTGGAGGDVVRSGGVEIAFDAVCRKVQLMPCADNDHRSFSSGSGSGTLCDRGRAADAAEEEQGLEEETGQGGADKDEQLAAIFAIVGVWGLPPVHSHSPPLVDLLFVYAAINAGTPTAEQIDKFSEHHGIRRRLVENVALHVRESERETKQSDISGGKGGPRQGNLLPGASAPVRHRALRGHMSKNSHASNVPPTDCRIAYSATNNTRRTSHADPDYFRHVDADAMSLLAALLAFVPEDRLAADGALAIPVFLNEAKWWAREHGGVPLQQRARLGLGPRGGAEFGFERDGSADSPPQLIKLIKDEVQAWNTAHATNGGGGQAAEPTPGAGAQTWAKGAVQLNALVLRVAAVERRVGELCVRTERLEGCVREIVCR